MQDLIEEKYVSATEEHNPMISTPINPIQDNRKIEIKKKPKVTPILQIPSKKKCFSATFRTSPPPGYKNSVETFIINEEDEKLNHEETSLDPQEKNRLFLISRTNKSETDLLKKNKKFGRVMNLTLEISKNIKKKDNLNSKEILVGIKKERKCYYFREKIIKNDAKFFFQGKKWILICNDDLKIKKSKEISAEFKKHKKSRDDLDILKINVNFLQNP